MAFTQTASLKNSNHVYQVSPTAKGYTLRDNGFVETKAGNFQLVRQLEHGDMGKSGIKLKIAIDKTLTQLKMSTTTKNGLQSLTIYNQPQYVALVEEVEFILAGLVERGVLVEG